MSQKNYFNCLKFSALAFFLLFFQVCFAQSGFNELGEIVEQKQKQLKQDVVLLVANKDTIIYHKDSKMFSATRGQAPIGYSSQWLTAAVVLKAVDEGKIRLDDKVTMYIPVFGSYMKSYLTIRQCLAHLSGIQAEQPKALKLFEKKKFASLEEEVGEYAKKHIQNNPGEVFRYNNMGACIAARIIEIVYKKNFDMTAQQKLFRPLGMRQTTFSTMDGSTVDPSEGARSSANDMIRFMTMLLNNGVYKGQRILSEESVKELRRINASSELIKQAPDMVKGYEYALGSWAVEENSASEASVLAAPSLGGTFPLIDFCRGYAFIYMQKELIEEERAITGLEIKGVLDGKFNSKCK
ncbi:beta-lactamase family protein [Chitinophagaceae bacterium LB-8]|jgi:CubicO group peptidase (beta-lactamase class C family)|uniref:Beta-lactamase family protein n=1 Tax=Paraflavisolibacter caeni TaxID=2982496 RepID=A0A9X3BHK2_9BACT|nr:serine hydrolase [Paraflavisolibacter caeni]MCU7552459.1 beta-lactamase family protein [Paraflavisolibacter caeni]